MAGAVGDDVAIFVRWIDDLDRAGFDDEEIEIGLAGVENCFAIIERAGSGQGAKQVKLAGIELGEGDGVFGGFNHGDIVGKSVNQHDSWRLLIQY